MKKYSVNVTNYAYKQLSEISEYISEVLFSPETAKKWLIKMRKEISELSIFPSKFILIDEEPWKSREIHRMCVDNYNIYYTIDETNSEVWIIAIVYARRNQKEQLADIELL